MSAGGFALKSYLAETAILASYWLIGCPFILISTISINMYLYLIKYYQIKIKLRPLGSTPIHV